ncbi:MAG: hypothetical protein IPI55_07695 [Flavobacteriales bacterium]|nr:hypothetical protein [Flavobacteriales bacterium]
MRSTLAQHLRSDRWSLAVVCVAVVACALLTWQWQLRGDDGSGWNKVIRGDAKGYYSYLPAVFIHGDLSHPAGGEGSMNTTPQGMVRKYSMGTAVAQLPFFLAGDAVARMQYAKRTGYEQPYHVSIAIGAIIALLIGLLVLRRVLLVSGFSDGTVAWVLVLLCGGTSLVYAAVAAAAYSHIWSFMLVACFLRCVQRGVIDRSARSIVAAGLLLGLVALIRPVNVIIVLALPMLLQGWPFSGPWKGEWPSARTILIAAVGCCAVVALQPLAWKLQTGHWVVWSYAEEGFHWSRPEVLQVLFGPMKGLFFWWPVLLAIIPGAVLVARNSRWAGGFGIGYFVVLIYITSAWWCWYYGDGYGLRPIIDHFPALAVALAAFVQWISGRWRIVAGGVAVGLCALQWFQIRQFEFGIIHPHSMSWQKYRTIFLKGDEHWRGALGGNYEMAQYAPNGYDTLFNGELPVSLVDAQHPYSRGLHLDSAALPDGRRLFVEAEVTRSEHAAGSSTDAIMVCEIGHDGEPYIYYKFKLNDLPTPPAGTTATWRYAFPMAAARPQDELKLYVWQTGEGAFTIDRFHATVKAVR